MLPISSHFDACRSVRSRPHSIRLTWFADDSQDADRCLWKEQVSWRGSFQLAHELKQKSERLHRVRTEPSSGSGKLSSSDWLRQFRRQRFSKKWILINAEYKLNTAELSVA